MRHVALLVFVSIPLAACFSFSTETQSPPASSTVVVPPAGGTVAVPNSRGTVVVPTR